MKTVHKIRDAFASFVRNETSGAVLLLAATALALLWANLGGHSYDAFWHTDVTFQFGEAELRMSL